MRRTKKFDDGGLASSGSQPAFGQQRSAYPSSPSGLGNNAPLVQIGSTAPAQAAPTLFGQAAPQQTQMKRGGKVKAKTNFAKGGKVRKYAVGGAMTPRAPAPMATPRPAVPTPRPAVPTPRPAVPTPRPAVPTPNPQAMSVAPRPTSIAPRPTAPAPTYSDPMAPYKTEEPMYTGFDKKQVYKRQKELDRYRERETSDALRRIKKNGNNPMPVLGSQRLTPKGQDMFNNMTAEERMKYLAATDYGQDMSGRGRQPTYTPIELANADRTRVYINPTDKGIPITQSVSQPLTPEEKAAARADIERVMAELAKLNAERQSINSGQTVRPAVLGPDSFVSRSMTPEEEAALRADIQRVMAATNPTREEAAKLAKLNADRQVYMQQVMAANPAGMKKGGAVKGYKKGGSIDGIAKKGKTKTQHFAKGGRVDGCAVRGKTKCKMR